MCRTLGFALLILAIAALSTAQTTTTTRLIPYFGTAVDSTGRPLSGQLTATFELFEEQQGGSPLWQETQDIQADERGQYAVYLGAATPLPQIAFTEERARWLSITIENQVLPRVMLVAVPYALRATDADQLGGEPASSYVRSRADGRLETSAGVVAAEAAVEGSGTPGQLAKFSSPTTVSSSVISESATNRIGVGLPDPTGGGVVDSVFTIRNFDNDAGFAVLNQTQQRRFALNTVSDGTWRLYDGVGGTWNLGLQQRNGSLFLAPATVGGPYSRLDVQALPGQNQAILANANDAPAIVARSASSAGISAFTLTGAAVQGDSQGFGGYAGLFFGKVEINGQLTKSGGSFKIDHPLDPTNRYLSHSFIESSDMMNVYNGNVTLDASGEAWIAMSEWFEALNRDFR